MTIEQYTTLIHINNTYINLNKIDYFEKNPKENTVYVHLDSGVSFLFCLDDWGRSVYEYLEPKKRGLL